MKKLLCVALIACCLSASAQIRKTKRVSRHSVHIWGDDFEGVVFTEKYKEWNTIERKSINPTVNDIELAEACLREGIDTLVIRQTYPYSKQIEYADSVKKWLIPPLECYVRQYFEYCNKKGEKIIYINCFHQYSHFYLGDKKEWLNHLFFVYDGGRTYWRVKINLNTMQLFDFEMNGDG